MNLGPFILGSIALIIKKYATQYQEDDLSKTLVELAPDLSLPRIRTYDFIIVGGGTAGSLLAGRLSDHFSVLLLESGGDPPPASYNVFLNDNVEINPAINNIFIANKESDFGLEKNGIPICRTGRMLGGSGSHNDNIFNRGSHHDWDNYAALTGDGSYSYARILQHFKSLESFNGHLIHEQQRQEFYGTSGPVYVETDWPPIIHGWLHSGKELGYGINDPNAWQTEGFSPMVKAIKNGQRVSSYTSFVKPKESYGRYLRVIKYSHVQQVLIDDQKRAYGVTFLRHGIPQIAHATREVILSGGTIQSPLTLLKSGIGPRDALEAANIPIKSEIDCVGKNLRDHVGLELQFTATHPDPDLLPYVSEYRIIGELNQYQNSNRRTGYFTRMSVGPQAFLVSSRAKQDGEGAWPDAQVLFIQKPVLGDEPPEVQNIGMQVVLNRPKSMGGDITLNSTAFLAGETEDTKLALIDFKLLSDPSDVEVLIQGVRLAGSIMEKTTTFRNLGVKYSDTAPIACGGLTFDSDEYWRCHIRQRTRIWQHYVGTCKMGRPDDPTAVVDPQLRVRGIHGLRVIDASVFPITPNANLNAPVMVLAEKSAHDIILQHRNPF